MSLPAPFLRWMLAAAWLCLCLCGVAAAAPPQRDWPAIPSPEGA